MAETLYLIDGSAIAYRAYFAFINRPLINSRGENTSAAFGFANTILKVLRDHCPDYMLIAFDTSAPTFRHELHPEYKATREKMPEDMANQLPRIRELVDAMGIPIVCMEGYEADDLIGTLAREGTEKGLDVTVLSGDKDFMQLVGPHVRLLNPKRGMDQYEVIDAEGVQAKFGVSPAQVVDVMGLMGDASDNVPGVPGVGPKTAARLVAEYGSLEAVLAAADGIKQKRLRENLLRFADQARLSRDLVTIRTNLPVRLDACAAAVGEFDRERLRALLRELEFTRMLRELGLDGEQSQPEVQVEYELVTTAERVAQVARILREHGRFSFDLETTSLDPLVARIVGIALAWEPGRGAYVAVGHERGTNVPLGEAMKWLGPLLADPEVGKCGQNLKFDTAVLKTAGYVVSGIECDAMVADYLLDPGGRQHNLEMMARRHLGYEMQSIEELIGSGREQTSFAAVDPDKACFYACEDADIALRVCDKLMPAITEQDMEILFQRVELPLIPVLRDMELRGVAVDVEFLRRYSNELGGEIERLSREIWAAAGEEFNINSTQQLAHILFEKLGLKPRRKTKTGYSTDVSVLEELALEHPLPSLLLDYRELAKLRSTYADALPQLVHPRTGRIHASFNQTVTATGRLSSSDPNLQNIPVRTPLGREIRKAFVPGRDDGVILSADYSQIELRLLAHLSGDPELCAAFRAGEDIHTRTASLLFELSPEFITAEMRAQAKTVNFGIIYGQTPFGLARQLGISVARAREFIESYFEVYSGVRSFIERTIADARERGYVTTLLGRRRYLPEIDSRNQRRREFAERTAVNSPIQGTQADMIKLAMIRIHRALEERGMDASLILQVHDELVLEVGRKALEAVRELVRTEMVQALELDVPVAVEVNYGANWFEAH